MAKKEKTISCKACDAENPDDATFCFHCNLPTKDEPKPKRGKRAPKLPPAAMAGVRRDHLGDRLDPVEPPPPPPEPAPVPPPPEPAPVLELPKPKPARKPKPQPKKKVAAKKNRKK